MQAAYRLMLGLPSSIDRHEPRSDSAESLSVAVLSLPSRQPGISQSERANSDVPHLERPARILQPVRRRGAVRWVATAAVPLAALALLAAAASARTPSPVPYKLGAYSGSTSQRIPRSYKGKIHFTVHRNSITDLSFTVGVVCNGLWASDSDSLPHFKAKVTSNGGFSFYGTTSGRQIRFRGFLKAGRATGNFSQSFSWGSKRCSMGDRASFTATR